MGVSQEIFHRAVQLVEWGSQSSRGVRGGWYKGSVVGSWELYCATHLCSDGTVILQSVRFSLFILLLVVAGNLFVTFGYGAWLLSFGPLEGASLFGT